MTDHSRATGAAVEAHYQFLTWLMPTLEKFPRSHKFTIGDRIESIALEVLEALVDATYTRDRGQHLRRANLGIEKLRFLLRLAADLRLLDRRRYEHAARALDETGRLIGGWMKAHGVSGGAAGSRPDAATA
jgi:23S rRNA-intervening sequence protein